MSKSPGSYNTEARYSRSRSIRASSRKESTYSFPVTVTKVPTAKEKTQARIDHLWKKWEEE